MTKKNNTTSRLTAALLVEDITNDKVIKMSKASDLIYEYVRAEVKLEEAHQALKDMTDKKESLLLEILDNQPLKTAMMTTGVNTSGKVCHLDHIEVGDTYEITVRDEPMSAYSLQDEPEVMESGDE